jgi:hypothetical protein
MVGDSVTYADFSIYVGLKALKAGIFGEVKFGPRVNMFLLKMGQQPGVKKVDAKKIPGWPASMMGGK